MVYRLCICCVLLVCSSCANIILMRAYCFAYEFAAGGQEGWREEWREATAQERQRMNILDEFGHPTTQSPSLSSSSPCTWPTNLRLCLPHVSNLPACITASIFWLQISLASIFSIRPEAAECEFGGSQTSECRWWYCGTRREDHRRRRRILCQKVTHTFTHSISLSCVAVCLSVKLVNYANYTFRDYIKITIKSHE